MIRTHAGRTKGRIERSTVFVSSGGKYRNGTRTCWVLQCDIRKFFASVDHAVLKAILAKHINGTEILSLLDAVIDSFETPGKPGVGLPLGNLTSQLLVNVYMNEFDQFVKRGLKEKYYLRYADDFVFFSDNRVHFENLLPSVGGFIRETLYDSNFTRKRY